jgi:site-specific recombinase XerD
MESITYKRFFGLHHITYLRSVALGVPIALMAVRHLGAEHHRAAYRAHAVLIAQARALARLHGLKDARLLGLVLGDASTAPPAPSIDDWMVEKGYSGFSYRDIIHLYEEAYPRDAKAQRRSALQARQIAVIDQLEDLAVRAAQPSDAIGEWFDAPRTQTLAAAGLTTLMELHQLIQRGGRWWRQCPAVGYVKADRIVDFLYTLIPRSTSSVVPVAATLRLRLSEATTGELDGSNGTNRGELVRDPGQATTDEAALAQWLAIVTTNSPATRKAYAREAERVITWAIVEKRKPVSSLLSVECTEYTNFLRDIPPAWCGAKGAKRDKSTGALNILWSPFNGSVSVAAQQRSIMIVRSWFAWMVADGYLERNPWTSVPKDKRVDMNKERAEFESRAFNKSTWAIIQGYFTKHDKDPAIIRAKFVFDFCEATGLRAQEFVSARLSNFVFTEGWDIKLVRKGGSVRLVSVPRQAIDALNEYLAWRAIPSLDEAIHESSYCGLPLVAPIELATIQEAPHHGIQYHALWSSVKTILRRVSREPGLTQAQQDDLKRGSPHWLRHTCGTRGYQEGIELEKIQVQFGQKSRLSAERYTKAQQPSVRAAFERVFK